MLNLPWRRGRGKAKLSSELSVKEQRKCSKGWEQGQGIKPPPKARQVEDPRADLLGQREAFKTKLPHLAGEELTKQSCSWKIAQLLASENNSFDHPKQTGRLNLTSQFQLTGRQKNQTLLTSQSSGETMSECLLLHQYQDWMPEE
jgi:hypothetical protein